MRSRTSAALAAALFASLCALVPASHAVAAPPSLGTTSIEQIAGLPDGMIVAISGDGLHALASSTENTTALPSHLPTGEVSVLDRPNTSSPWTVSTQLPHTPTAMDAFGSSLAFDGSGDAALVESFDVPARASKVEAYRNAGGWQASPVWEAAPNDSAQATLALSGDSLTAVVAHGGTIHVFAWTGTAYAPEQDVSADLSPTYPTIAMSDDASTIAWVTVSGGVEVARRSNGSYGTPTALPLSSGMSSYTGSVAMSSDGTTIAVTDATSTPRRVLIWARERDDAYYVQATLALDPDVDVGVGTSLSLSASGDRLAVNDSIYGASNTPPYAGAGAVFIYERAAGAWSDAARVRSPSPPLNEHFGNVVQFAGDGATLIIGAVEGNSGALYFWSSDTPAPDGSPDARDDSVATKMDEPVAIDVTANDMLADNAAIRTYDASSGHGGTVVPDGTTGRLLYTPPSNQFLGTDTFTYTLCDDDAIPTCDTATVSVDVQPINAFDTTAYGPLPGGATPILGTYATDGVYWYRPGTAADIYWTSTGLQTHTFTTSSAPAQTGTYTPVANDFDGNGRTDILWYAPGSTPETMWKGQRGTFKSVATPQLTESYQPLVGHFDCAGSTDILWYAPGSAPEALWFGSGNGFTVKPTLMMSGTLTPIVGHFDDAGCGEVFWYAPGTAHEYVWRYTTHGFVAANAPLVDGTYTPLAGDFNGDGYTDILWYGAGSTPEMLWHGGPHGFTRTSVPQVAATTYRPVVGDFNGDHKSDVFWYSPGSTAEMLWRGTADGFVTVAVPPVAGMNAPVVGDLNGDGRDDLLFTAPHLLDARIWFGRVA